MDFTKISHNDSKNEYPRIKDNIAKYSQEFLRTFNTCAEIIEKEVVKNGLTMEEFHNLRVISSDLLSSKQCDSMKTIRKSVEEPTKDTVMQKAITEELFKKYLDNIATVRGFITRAQDTNYLNSYMEFYKILRLDYYKSKFLPYIDDSMYLIRFKSFDIDKANIPFGKNIDGDKSYKMPCTGNGFTSAKGNHVVPEYELEKEISIRDGAEIYKVTQDGEEILVAVFDEDENKFYPVK